MTEELHRFAKILFGIIVEGSDVKYETGAAGGTSSSGRDIKGAQSQSGSGSVVRGLSNHPSSASDQSKAQLSSSSSKLTTNKGSVPFDMEQLAYLSRLGTQGLDSLNGEVARLNEELAIVEHQTRDMASQNYQIFVQSAHATHQIKTLLDDGNKSVGQLTGNTIPIIRDEVQAFGEGPCHELVLEVRGTESLLKRQETINKILEMQWIVRRCLAEENLGDAIKVLTAAQNMMKNITDPPAILTKTCNQVTQLKTEIQQALLAKLSSGNIGLSECLQTVSLLRNFFPDDKSLRFRFLQSRMKDVPFETARTWVFDTLTQHRAAFGADSNHYLSTWAAIQLNRVFGDMEKHIDRAESTDSLMTQASYFGESLARVGADVRGLIIPIFVEHLIKKTHHDLTQFEIQFVRNLHSFNLSSVPISETNSIDASDIDQDLEFTEQDDLTPPKQLIPFTPLAIYLNEVLTLLNRIGKCPLTQCSTSIALKLNHSIQKIGDELETWGKSEWLTCEMKEQNVFNRMNRNFELLLVPHLDKIIRVIFPPVRISEVTGLGISKCAEMLQVKYMKTSEEVK